MAFDIHVGDRVCFDSDGTSHVGLVNRITPPATVLVRIRGALSIPTASDLTFYVPLPLLKKENPVREL